MAWIVGRVNAAQVGAQPWDRREPREKGRGGPGRAAIDSGGDSERGDEGRAGYPDAHAGTASDEGDRIGREQWLLDDEVGVEGREELGESGPRGVGRGDGGRQADTPAAVREDGGEAALAEPDAAGGHEVSGSAAWTCSAETAWAFASAAAVRE